MQVSSQETFSNYRARIQSLLLANSSRFALHLCQSKVYKDEILSLRREVRSLTNELVSRRIRPPLSHPIPWVANFNTSPPFWSLNSLWTHLYPEQDPGPNPTYGPVLPEEPGAGPLISLLPGPSNNNMAGPKN